MNRIVVVVLVLENATWDVVNEDEEK